MIITTSHNIQFEGNDKQSILDSALQAGFVFEYSCNNGQCGVCKTTLLEGDIFELREQVALSDADRKNKRILSCCCAPKIDILIDSQDLSELKGIEVKTFPVRINKIEKHTEQIIQLELRLPPSANLKFLEGQYIDVIVPNSIRRSYSIANRGGDNTITLLIKKVDNGQLSDYWFNDAKQNDLLRIEGPKGTFFFRESTKPIIFLATGTGIAPIKAILDKLDELGSELKLFLYWGNRKPEDFFWQPNYQNLDLQFIPVLSKKDEAWTEQLGYVQDYALADHENIGNTDVYACGSLSMIESAKALFIKSGLEEKYFYSDAFVSS